ncbi:MAG: 3-deoxy-manno-octulosonate cytidylyltransferase [Blastocatellia bacterium]|nr:3-deoxy-manno-octulosonate cytidylyltransferase [Blastocatellia bacterium]
MAIIPSRFASTRLPGKPLLDIAGKPMVVRVCECAASARTIDRVIVATDDERIADAVTAEGFEAMMTSDRHETGTDRLAEVAATLVADFIVNVQGDEPLLPASTIDAAVQALVADSSAVCSTTCEAIEKLDDFRNPNVVKVVLRDDGRALYFSRAAIPYPRDAAAADGVLCAEDIDFSVVRRHTGLYVFRRAFLLEFARMSPSPLERIEKLEQLRILERGYDIRVVDVREPSFGIDTQDDLDHVRALWEARSLVNPI